MDITVTSVTSYSPVQEPSLQQAVAAVQRQLTRPRDAAASLRQEGAIQRDAQALRQEESAREARNTATSQPVRPSGFEFENKDNTQLMKVNDSKGVLIYQVPSKGQLALLEATEATSSKVKTTA